MEAVYGGGDDSSTGGELTELLLMEPAFRDEGVLGPTDTQTLQLATITYLQAHLLHKMPCLSNEIYH